MSPTVSSLQVISNQYPPQTQIILHFQSSAEYFRWVFHHLETELSSGTLFVPFHIAAQLLFPQLGFPFPIPYLKISDRSPLSRNKVQISSPVIKSPPEAVPSLCLQPIFYFCFLHKSLLLRKDSYALLSPSTSHVHAFLCALSSARNAGPFPPMKIQPIHQDQLQF